MPLFTKPQFNSVWAATGSKLTPDNAKISQGWVVEIPPHEYENWVQCRQDQLLAHVNQVGIPMWDATVEYQAGKSYIQGTTSGIVYRAVTTNTNVNPELDIQGNWTVAFQASGEALLKSQNLADVPDKALARQNLGIATTEFYDGRYLTKANNLADVPNKASARTNLGLGNSSTLDVGTGAGTVAAGNDARIVNAVQTSRQISSGAGLVGGGNLSTNLSLGMGTPSTITRTSTNYVAGTTHGHAVDFGSAYQGSWRSENGYVIHANGMWEVWGVTDNLSEGTYTRNFHTPFPNACVHMQLTIQANGWSNANEIVVASLGWTRTNFSFGLGFMQSYNAGVVRYYARGY